MSGPVVGNLASQSVLSSTLVALPVAGSLRLIQFDYQCAPEEATENLPFVALGSGQPIADPFLAFLRRVFWPTSLPTLVEGVFAVFWTLQHAIQTNPGGVADPKQIISLKPNGKSIDIHELTEAETLEHAGAIDEAEQTLRQLRDRLAGVATEATATPPPAPPAS